MIRALFALAFLLLGAETQAHAAGRFVRWEAVESEGLRPRNVTVWLPPGYDGSWRRYPVLYMHDGQNLFEAVTSGPKGEWGVDEVMSDLIAQGRIRPAIIVGVWNTPARSPEYMPLEVYNRLPQPWRGRLSNGSPNQPLSNVYLDFLVTELKPRVDREFRTLPGREHTLIAGSSMGALISLYAIARHPKTFGAAAAISIHWPLFGSWPVTPRPADEQAAVTATWTAWLRERMPGPGLHRLYFDHGTETLDSLYAPYQAEMDKVLDARGWRAGCDRLTRRFEGAEHDEPAWRARLHEPLTFLLGPKPVACAGRG